jgi:hypothetical protein
LSPPFTDLGCSFLPSEASELYHPNGDADSHHESEDDDKDEEDDNLPCLFGTHNGDGDYTASQFSVQQRIMHFLGERIDQQMNRVNVEICLLIEAGTAVTNERAVTSEVRNQMMLDKYRNLVRMFSQDDFVSPSIQDDMCIKLFNGRASMATQVINCGGSLRTGGKKSGQNICQSCQKRLPIIPVATH